VDALFLLVLLALYWVAHGLILALDGLGSSS
jgi:hypothetical protein